MSGFGHELPLTVSRLPDMHSATVSGYVDSVQRHMPHCPFRDMALWALKGGRENADFFSQINAITQLGKMTTLLLSPVADEQQWPFCVAAASIMNAWQVHEVFSDNLAIGLGLPLDSDDISQQSRRRLLQIFNQEMDQALSINGPSDRAKLLERFNQLARNISLSDQSLVTEKHQQLIQRFSRASHSQPSDIDKSIAPILTANILSCVEVLDHIQNDDIRDLTRRWLRHRYMSVNALLDTAEPPLDDLVMHGTRTILVVPTLAYYVDIFLPEGIRGDFINGTLQEALCSAATLVRLLNDIGTYLLTSSDGDREAHLDIIQGLLSKQEHHPLIDVLARQSAVTLTRLIKDARFREFNIGFHGIGHLKTTPQLISQLIRRLQILGGIYSSTKGRLLKLATKIDETTRSPTCSRILTSFVAFHEHLYANHHHASQGEYAI